MKMIQPKRVWNYCILIFVFSILMLNTCGAERPRRFKQRIKRDISRYKGMLYRTKFSRFTTSSRRLTENEEAMQLGPPEEEADPPIGEREGPLKSIIKGSVKLPMYAAADYEIGQYFVDINVGTPSKTLRLIVDTGSDLSWVKCPKGGTMGLGKEPRYDPTKSSTFEPIGCDTLFCKEDFQTLRSLAICPIPEAPCLYNYTYGDYEETATYGSFGKETLSLPTTTGSEVLLKNILLGCSTTFTGRANVKAADGILGLGINPYSFSVHAVNSFGGTFSCCLVDHLAPANVTSYLIFGEDKEKASTYEYMRYTALRTNSLTPFFWVDLKGISMDSKMLDIPPLVWREEVGGTILDSGTSLTYFAEPAYRAIMKVLIPFFEKEHPKLSDHNGDGRIEFEYCFNSTETPVNMSKVPRLEIHFADGARFKPLIKSYIIDDAPHVKCIGLLEAMGGMNIIGNIFQQNYLWEFDLHHSSIGFAPSTCR